MERIVVNLVANALKHTPEGTTVAVEWSKVDDDHVELLVHDDGQGVPADLRESIFEEFNRGDSQLGHVPGTGVGLALVAQFAELHGGSAWVEPRTGGGSSFIVRLP